MAAKYIYKNIDLRTATIYDLAEVLKDFPPIFVSPEKDLSDEQERILSLITYSEEYQLNDLKQKLEDLYKDELVSIL